MILVTGGTGFVGRNIVRKLIQENQKVRCLVRNASRLSIFEGMELESSEGDISRPESLLKAMEGVDTVIHLVGIIREFPPDVVFEKLHAEGTANVVEACKKSGVKKIVHMSAMGTGPEAVSRYHKTKWQAEETVRASGLEYVIFRPSIICGADDEFVNMFAKMIRQTSISRIIPVIGSGEYKMQVIYVGDVAHCFVKAAVSDDIVNATYELGGPEQLPFNEILDTIMHVMGRKRIKIHIPIAIAKILAFFMEKTLSSPLLTREQLIMLQIDNVGDITAMKRDFGFEPMRFEDAIRTYIRE